MKYYLIPALLLLLIAMFVYLIPTRINKRYYRKFRQSITPDMRVKVNGRSEYIVKAPRGSSWVEFMHGTVRVRTSRENCYPV